MTYYDGWGADCSLYLAWSDHTAATTHTTPGGRARILGGPDDFVIALLLI